ncbi:hypothetical protein RCL1_000723 [Eukaryota sp. TZLM3-RCL]
MSKPRKKEDVESTIHKLLYKPSAASTSETKVSRYDAASRDHLHFISTPNGTTVSIPQSLCNSEQYSFHLPHQPYPPQKICPCGNSGKYPRIVDGQKSYFCSLSCFNAM